MEVWHIERPDTIRDMTEAATTTTTARVTFLGLNGWAVVEGTRLVTACFRTEAEAQQALAEREEVA